jgi:hypothetical protein
MTAGKQTKTGARKSKKLRLNKKTLKDLGPRATGPKGGAIKTLRYCPSEWDPPCLRG